jgi:alpha-L-rhamnosidase
MKITLSSLLAAFVFILAGCTSGSTVKIKDLRVEMKENPVGVGVSQPRFMWKISSESPDLVQTSYQIQVADSPDKLKNEDDLLWDTGEIKSDASIQIPYEGSPLQSRKQYYWRVKSNTNQGTTNWSEVNTWSMALLNPSEWKATWIGENNLSNQGETYQGKSRLAARYLRKEFTADKTVQRAVLYISGLGSSESYINGKRVSEDIFAPGPSWYPNRVYYNVYDVTGLLSKDKNTIGIALGNGRYFGMRDMQKATLPSLLAQLEIEYTDGSQTTILSDTSWKVTSKGPIIANNEFDGEEYDARLELEGWNKNGFDDSKWMAADVMETPPGELTVQANPNLRIQEEIKPVNITERPDGKYIIDMGQNMVGWLRMKVKGQSGDTLKLRFAYHNDIRRNT